MDDHKSLVALPYGELAAKCSGIKRSVSCIKLPESLLRRFSPSVYSQYPGLSECLDYAETTLRLLLRYDLDTSVHVLDLARDIQTIAITQCQYLRDTIEESQAYITDSNVTADTPTEAFSSNDANVDNAGVPDLSDNPVMPDFSDSAAISDLWDSTRIQNVASFSPRRPVTHLYVPITDQIFQTYRFSDLVNLVAGIVRFFHEFMTIIKQLCVASTEHSPACVMCLMVNVYTLTMWIAHCQPVF